VAVSRRIGRRAVFEREMGVQPLRPLTSSASAITSLGNAAPRDVLASLFRRAVSVPEVAALTRPPELVALNAARVALASDRINLFRVLTSRLCWRR
jgi:hypothetical protein